MKHLLLITFLFSFIFSVKAQESPSTKAAFGMHLHQMQRDFGIGLNATSPYFLNNKLAVRLKGNLQWNEHLEDGETVWSPYAQFSLGLASLSADIGGFFRLYSEGGVTFLIPPSDISSSDLEIGGYGLFGFEFYMDSHHSYFIEIGGVGGGATADKLPGSAIFANGFLVMAGYRFAL